MELYEWRSNSAAMLDRLYPLIIASQENRKALEARFPAWREPRIRYPEEHLRHDARLEVFNSFRVILENAQVSYMTICENLTDPAWYLARNQKLSPGKIKDIVKENAIMVKWFTFHASASVVEDCFRAVVRSDTSTFQIEKIHRANLKTIIDRVLEATNLTNLTPLFEVIRLVRNTIHNNGRYTDGDKNIQCNRRDFDFFKGQEINWLNEENTIWLIENLHSAMNEIVQTPPVSNIPACPRGEI